MSAPVISNSVSVDGWTCWDDPNPPADSDGNVWVWQEIDGWFGGLDPRGNPVPRPMIDGDFDGSAPFAGRTVTVKGTLLSPSRYALQVGLDRMARVLAGQVRRSQLVIDERVRSLTRGVMVRLAGPTLISRLDTYRAEWSITMYSPDSGRYGVTTHTISIGPFKPGTGRVYNLTFPRHYGAVGNDGRGHVFNAGDRATAPTITFFGPSVNPAIRRVGGNTLQLLMTLSQGDTAILDCAKRTVLVNGASRRQFLSADSRWIILPPGDTDLFYNVDSGTGLCQVQWLDAWT
jgi:hypothetical protein